MVEILNILFSPDQYYLPHGHCYLWQTPLVMLHVVSNGLIALAYFSIPAILLYFVFLRQNVPFLNIFVLFGAFIILCGIGHLLEIWTLWHPAYWLSGIEQALTAIVSCYTAISMVTLIPQFLSLRSPEELESINQSLSAEIETRKQIENTLRESEHQERVRSQALQEMLQKLQQTQSQLIQSEKMAALGKMVGGIAHEINNPISFIYSNIDHARQYSRDMMGLINLYRQSYPQPSERIATQIETIDLDFIQQDFTQILDSMKSGADRIKNIVLSLRSFSHLNQVGWKSINLNFTINQTLALVANRLFPPGCSRSIEVVRQWGELPEIECDPGQLNQAIWHLLDNAIDALTERIKTEPDFPGRIEIETTCIPENELFATRVVLIIRDNGIGIPDEIIDKIFDPFFSTKPIGKGTGLGLANAYQVIVQQHRGVLSCTSTPGVETCFRVELPLHQEVSGKVLRTMMFPYESNDKEEAC